MDKSFCIECEKNTDYTVVCHEHKPIMYLGERVVVDKYYDCFCCECGEPISVREYDKRNDMAVFSAYKKQLGTKTSKTILTKGQKSAIMSKRGE